MKNPEKDKMPDNNNPEKSDPSPEPDWSGDYYFNSDGLVTFTADYLLARGYCCGNGCLNCPYDYKAVPEPRRSALLEKRRSGQQKG